MPDRKLPVPENEADRKLLANVATHGWHVLGVFADENSPGFTYSIGMYHTLGHPEILIMGLKPTIAHPLINNMGDAIRLGRVYSPGSAYEDIAQGFPLAFVSLDRKYYRKYLGYALWFYQSFDFPVLQCVWPDKAGKFPWDAGYDSRFFDAQRILGAGRKKRKK